MASDTRQRLVTVARELVHRSSYAAVSIEDVCSTAGVHRGSLYHFFPSKEALGLAVVDANWVLMDAMLAEAFRDDVAPLARIDRFVHAFGSLLATTREQMGATPGCPLGNLAAELAGHGEAGQRLTGILDAWTRYFTAAIDEARRHGDLSRATDPGEAALRVLAYLQGVALLAKAYDRPGLVDQMRSGVRMLLDPPA
ncbi:TetR/AcrR family transcriptional regulator [Solwaraspora sp. WMMD791]|uniref:TetR/AcrR family transcriptional regulator n=1 Tax=Solwaraspora sp. WMMD791 TaxID=3016086 RepID=UPI00249B27D6|nr:TetR/AcrR family transcriptional regulator [Solwaraspora sp. WMMD791]WFE28051.1 TetR/AcrR family transcriptional regulator [Solwaraspora sp. WMMD791]